MPHDVMEVPDELSMFELLEVDPSSESNPPDGFWKYVLSDDSGVVVELSFDIHQRSLQTAV
jgi:hypothetical protein